ncbi:phage tail tape measure protein [Streptomyces sioyaensis]|uniref:phage tail tape measure protein n=1 Tax=Streptomyces TaxID=1883 RepID=UPI0036E686B7
MADQRTLRVVVVGNANSAQRALGDLGDSADEARRDTENLGDAWESVGDGAGQLGANADQAGGQLDAMGGKAGALKGAMGALGGAIITALPLVALAGFAKGLERIGEKAKLAAQLGVTGPDAARAGKVAGDLYAQGWGESFADAGEAVKRVTQDIGVDMNSADFKPIASKVMALSDTFDVELGGTTRAVSQMMRTGLAKNANEALDVIAAGMTHGVDKSEDFLDTLNEYGTQFRKLGLDGATATGLLSQGLKAGARDADLVADALKEFSIRAVDGSTASAEGYKLLGLEAGKMTAQIAKGGPEASAGLQTVLGRLKAMKDPVKQNAAAVALFGTQSEDLGKALFALDPKKAVTSLGKVKGAAGQMADTMSGNAAHKVEAFKRKLENGFTSAAAGAITGLQGLGRNVSPIFEKVGKAAAPFVRGLGQIGLKIKTSFETGAARTALDQLGQKLSGIWQVVGPALGGLVSYFRTQLMPVFQELWTKAQPVLVQLWSTFKTYLDLIKLGIQGFIAVVQWLWQTFGTTIIGYVKAAWSAIWQVISGVLSVIQGIYNVFIGIFTGNWSRAWQGVKQIFSGVWNIIVGVFRAVWNTITSILRIGADAVKGVWNLAWSAVSSFFKSIWNGVIGFFSGALGRLKGYASSGVSAVKNFFVNGFQSLYTSVKGKLSSVVGAVREIPGNVKSTLSALPGQLLQIGKNVIQGLVNGIRNSLGAVMSAARAIVDHIPGPIRKALGIHSPSRVMAEIGKFVTQGLVKGMLGGTKSVAKTAAKLHQLVTKAFSARKISKGRANSLHKWLGKQDRALWKLALSREWIAKKISTANAKIADLKKAKADMASSVTSKAKDYGAFMGVYDSAEYGDNSGSAILSRLKGRLQGIIDFRKNLSALAQRGLGKGIISEIANAGPDEGGQMAKALLNADLGEIKQLNSTYSAIGSESSKLGSFVAGNYYDAGIHATEGLIKGLKAKEKALTKQIESMSKKMVKSLKKALGIHSPSRVFAKLGGFTSQGFALGIRKGQGDVQGAVDALAATRPSTSRSVASSAVSAASGSRTSSAGLRDVVVNVKGNVTSERDLAKAIATTVRDELVRNGKRNGGRIF